MSKQRIVTASGVVDAEQHLVSRLLVLGITRERIVVLAHDLPRGAGVDGLLGLDCFRDRRLTIDFRAGVIDLD